MSSQLFTALLVFVIFPPPLPFVGGSDVILILVTGV